MILFTPKELKERSRDKPRGYKKDVMRLAVSVNGGFLMLSTDDAKALREKYGNRTSLRFKVRSFWTHLSINLASLWMNRRIGAPKNVAKARYDTCAACPELSKAGFCGVCGCNMRIKTKLVYAVCPLAKW